MIFYCIVPNKVKLLSQLNNSLVSGGASMLTMSSTSPNIVMNTNPSQMQSNTLNASGNLNLNASMNGNNVSGSTVVTSNTHILGK